MAAEGEPGKGKRALTLRLVRAQNPPFDAGFCGRHEGLWPVARAASVFAGRSDWPEPAELSQAFEREAPVRFERFEPRRRGRGQPVDTEILYDSHILRGTVPTRARCWHDFLNALVWATFPRAKQALHRRQHELIRSWASGSGATLPNARTPRQDALALLDEGGVIALRSRQGELRVPFGHGLLEGLALGVPAMVPRGLAIEVERLPAAPGEALALVDEKLAQALAAPLEPQMLSRCSPAAGLGWPHEAGQLLGLHRGRAVARAARRGRWRRDLGQQRRDALHRRAPDLRALVQAGAARADPGPRFLQAQPGARPHAGLVGAGAAAGQHRALAGRLALRADRDADHPRLPRLPRQADPGQRVPVGAAARDRGADGPRAG